MSIGLDSKSKEVVTGVYYADLSTPIGLMRVASTAAGLCRVALPGEPQESFMAWLERVFPGVDACESTEANREVIHELEEYFAGRLTVFGAPLDMRGTEFQRSVWIAVAAIPYGETRSYREIAEQVGRPAACRAVGAANGANPLPPFVPCHRVVGKDGSLTGYGGGLEMKAQLLDLERPPAQRKLPLSFHSIR